MKLKEELRKVMDEDYDEWYAGLTREQKVRWHIWCVLVWGMLLLYMALVVMKLFQFITA